MDGKRESRNSVLSSYLDAAADIVLKLMVENENYFCTNLIHQITQNDSVQ